MRLKLPEAPTDCCMAGCAKCVWSLYAQEFHDFKKSIQDLKSRNLNQDELQLLTRLESTSMIEIDPSIKAFLDMNNKL